MRKSRHVRGILFPLLMVMTLLTSGYGLSAMPATGYYSYSLDVSGGLSSNIVYGIVKWKDGCVWMATRQGIDRYDGFAVKHYTLFKDDIRTSDDGQRIAISTDGIHALWAFTDSGQIYRYDGEGDDFQHVAALSDRGIHATLNRLEQIGDRLYACTSDGVYCLDIRREEFLFQALRGQAVRDIKPYADDRLIAGGAEGLSILNHDLELSEHIGATRDVDVECICVDRENGRIFLGTDGHGAWIYSRDGLRRIHGGLSHAIVRAITLLDESSFLIGCDGNGVFLCDRTGDQATLFATDLVPEGELSLNASSVYSILVDDGNIWVTSYRGGVTLFRKDADAFLIRDVNEKVVSSNFVHDISEGLDGDLWMAFNSSIGHYDLRTGTFRKYLDKAAGFLACAQDDEGFLWCGGYNTGTFRMNGRTGEAESFPSLSGGSEQDCIFAIEKDGLGNIWIGGLNFDLTRITVSGHSITKKFYPLRGVSDILPISRDTLLLGTNDGLRILDQETGNAEAVRWSDADGNGITPVINCLSYARGRKEVWIGTEGGGLLCFSLSDGTITPFSSHDGLPSNYIAGMEIDPLERLWASTENSGLFVLDLPTRKVVTSLERSEGLFCNEFFPASSCLLSSGEVIFGGYYGAVVIPTLAQFRHPEFGRISFNGLRVGNEKVTMRTHPRIVGTPLDQMRKMTLPYTTRSFSLSVGTDDLYNQNAARLYWRLLGSFDEWQALGPDRTIEINNLAPGRYTLEIRGERRSDGSYVSRSVDITTRQVFWLQWYTLLFYVLLAALLTYLGIVYYNHRLEKRSFEEKIGFFTNVAHDIKTPLTLVSAPLEQLGKTLEMQPATDEQRYLLSTARNNVRHLSEMVGQLMEMGKLSLQDGLSETRSIDIMEYLRMVRLDYKTLMDEKGIYFHLEAAPGSYEVQTDPKLLARVLENLISNAVKYTAEGGVTVRLSRDGERVLVDVADTGMGISEEDAKKLFSFSHRGRNAIESGIPGNGIGLFFTHTIVRKLGGELTFRSSLGKGSTFRLSLPPVQAESGKASPMAEAGERQPDGWPAKATGYSTHRETVLVVEDNDELRGFLAHALADTYNLLDASAAEDALRILQEHSVDLVISDIVMPGMHGDALCRQIKSHIETSHIPVILLSALTDKEVVATGLSGGADDYLTKPVDMDILRLKIQGLFENRKKLHSYYLSRMNVRKPDVQEARPQQTDLDSLFLQKMAKAVRDNLSNSEFTVNDLCNEVAMSRTLLYEKTRKLLGMAPNDFIRDIRLKQAKVLLEEGSQSVTEVAEACGFSDVRYFSTVFKKYYGISPSKVAPARQDA